jgi:DNA-binding response OmpR family regulator
MEAKRILVIDDDPDFLAYVGIVLRSQGYDVASATDVANGLAAARRVRPHLVIADVMISYDLTGANLCHDMRAEPLLARVPILMESAILDDHDDRSIPRPPARRCLHGQATDPARAAGPSRLKLAGPTDQRR